MRDDILELIWEKMYDIFVQREESMNVRVSSGRMLLTYAAFYLVFAAAATRAIVSMWGSPDVPFLLVMLGLYLVLLLVEPPLVRRNLAFLHVLNALQTAIALTLLLFVGWFDFFSLLFIPPCAQSIILFPRRTAYLWIGGICLVMEFALLAHFPFSESIGYLIIYPAAIFLITSFTLVARQAEEAQRRSEELLADLQVANRKLQNYAAQVQELAAANERNRLARELHDSVTQIIFGLTLTAQAARILLERDPSRVAGQLDHMQVLAQSALAEMRALIQQLHPRSIAEEGLAAALRRLVAEHQVNDGLTVDLVLHGETHLPAQVEEALYRVTQEALNNIVKHARTDQAMVTLDIAPERVVMTVADSGLGFDPANVPASPGHLGLTSMAERIQALGGAFVITSKRGNGTCLRVELNLDEEVVRV